MKDRPSISRVQKETTQIVNVCCNDRWQTGNDTHNMWRRSYFGDTFWTRLQSSSGATVSCWSVRVQASFILWIVVLTLLSTMQQETKNKSFVDPPTFFTSFGNYFNVLQRSFHHLVYTHSRNINLKETKHVAGSAEISTKSTNQLSVVKETKVQQNRWNRSRQKHICFGFGRELNGEGTDPPSSHCGRTSLLSNISIYNQSYIINNDINSSVTFWARRTRTDAKKRKVILSSSMHASSSVMSLKPQGRSLSSQRLHDNHVNLPSYLYQGNTKFSRTNSNTCRTVGEILSTLGGFNFRRKWVTGVPPLQKHPLWNEPSGPTMADGSQAAASACV